MSSLSPVSIKTIVVATDFSQTACKIIHGGETNCVMATVTLFVSIFNLFTSLLHLLGFATAATGHRRPSIMKGDPASPGLPSNFCMS